MAFQFNGISSEVTIDGQIKTDAGAYYLDVGTNAVQELIPAQTLSGATIEKTMFEKRINHLSPLVFESWKIQANFNSGTSQTTTLRIYVNNELAGSGAGVGNSANVIVAITETPLNVNDVLKITIQSTVAGPILNAGGVSLYGSEKEQKPSLTYEGL